ncbi:phage holin family protein [Streptomyces sp. UG1]|uniref:phage holin family protein n=1 Tax=Streptomyces sp. UG1 TaxID=3417652 RepID=UPI003CF031FE
MDRLDHLEHLDRELVDELAQVARETVRDELREQTRRQRRRATLYAASGAVALYAGAALALALGLGLAAGLPDWAAALITAVILGAVAYVLRGAARPTAEHRAGTAAQMPYPPMPSAAPTTDAGAQVPPRPDDIDPEQPHHRA